MKNLLPNSLTLAAIAAFLLTTAESHAGVYGVTRGGRVFAAGPRGVAVAGPNSITVAGRRGVAVARRPVAATLPALGRGRLPGGYIRTLPGAYRRVPYGGFACLLVAGIYYREVIYGGETVYVVVN